MTILVTGAAGFVAATLVRSLLERGASVLGVDNLSRGRRENIAFAQNSRAFRFVQADLTDLPTLEAAVARHRDLGAIDEVWHLAANSDIPAGIANPEVDLRDTFMTSYNTLALTRSCGARKLVFASSSAIYGDMGDRELTEDAGPLFPISTYGAMKLASEAAISAAAETFLESALIFRFPNVVGVPATHGVIFDFIRRLRQTPDVLDVLGDGTQQKAYLHVSDLVDAMLRLQAASSARRDVYNIGPFDDGVTVRAIAEETVAAVAPSAAIRFGQGSRGWVGDVPRFRYSVARLKTLGWRPSLDSLGAVRRAIREIAALEDVV